ncbi:MAG: CBS domain-containing protein [Planctomycetes bacterium]|nr:CBS domain-containing protein [Planctomycetota bacterium]
MLVRDALVHSPFVVSPNATLFALVDGILAGNQTTASVVDGDRLVGVVSATDVLKQLVPAYLAMDENLAHVLHASFFEEELGKLRNVQVHHAMVRDVDTLPPDASVMQAVAMFVRRGHKTVPIVDDGRFVGAVTRRSVLKLVRGSVDD